MIMALYGIISEFNIIQENDKIEQILHHNLNSWRKSHTSPSWVLVISTMVLTVKNKGTVTCAVCPEFTWLVTFFISNYSTGVVTWDALQCGACTESGKKKLAQLSKIAAAAAVTKNGLTNAYQIICQKIHSFGNDAVATVPCDHPTFSGKIFQQPHAAHSLIRFLSSMRNYFIYLCYLSVHTWQEM